MTQELVASRTPRAARPRSAHEAAPHHHDSRTYPRPRALLVDDDESTREMYAWCLRAAGWHVEMAGDGEDALLIAPVLEPDVIVMDLRLPGIDGLEATRRLKASGLTRGIPVVGCSAFDLTRAETLARQAGCEQFLAKPCSPDDLRNLLEALLTQSRD